MSVKKNIFQGGAYGTVAYCVYHNKQKGENRLHYRIIYSHFKIVSCFNFKKMQCFINLSVNRSSTEEELRKK